MQNVRIKVSAKLYTFFAMLESYLVIPKSHLVKFIKNRGTFRTNEASVMEFF